MRLNVKNMFIFASIYTSIYVFLINQFSNFSVVQNNANFGFMNLSTDMFYIESIYGGVNSYYFNVFGNVLNFTFVLYIISYISLPFYFIIEFFTNIILLISYEIDVIQYPVSILPYGIGNFISGIFYIVIIIIIITGIKIVQSGIGD